MSWRMFSNVHLRLQVDVGVQGVRRTFGSVHQVIQTHGISRFFLNLNGAFGFVSPCRKHAIKRTESDEPKKGYN